MDNSNDLKSIWATAKTDDLPAADEMKQVIREHRNKTLQRKVIVIVIATVSVIVLLGITFIFKAEVPTTRIGQYAFILAGCILIITNVRSIKRYYHFQDFSNRDFLKFLEKTRQNQIYFYQKTQVAGLALWSIGLLFSIFELVRQNIILCVAAYSLTVIFLIFLWLVVRRRVYVKRAKKLASMIKRLETLLKQL